MISFCVCFFFFFPNHAFRFAIESSFLLISGAVWTVRFADPVTPWTAACQASLSMEFSWQEYWSVLPLSTGDLPDSGIEPMSPAL